MPHLLFSPLEGVMRAWMIAGLARKHRASNAHPLHRNVIVLDCHTTLMACCPGFLWTNWRR
ncbi:hypothetical protein CBM2634_U170007 [Cupriavidus taiwanensis]|uniref:Uncharacterized protein n=1 Tax=Cupriavidus taiwanensis TaxID=164546 RepID=A0A375JG25_9BURK|nr:hypothetical protein CBM2634_U170007 [Cupriavidus taiwanensis]